jgi:hypothetical protein
MKITYIPDKSSNEKFNYVDYIKKGIQLTSLQFTDDKKLDII